MKKPLILAAAACFFLVSLARPAQKVPPLDEQWKKRDERFQVEKLLDSIGITPGMTVAEVGAGEGYLVFKLGRLAWGRRGKSMPKTLVIMA